MHSLNPYPQNMSRGSSRSYQSLSVDESRRGEEGVASSGIGLSGSSAASSTKGSNCGLELKKRTESPLSSSLERCSSSEGSLDSRLNLNGSKLTVFSVKPRKHCKTYNALTERDNDYDANNEIIHRELNLVCYMCRKPCNHLLALSCAHRICNSCLKALTREAEHKKSALWCFACRVTVSPLNSASPRAFAMKSQFTNYQNVCKEKSSNSDARFLPCQICDINPATPATRSCVTCLARYCEDCLAITHPKKAPFIHHQIVDSMLEGEHVYTNQMFCANHPMLSLAQMELKSKVNELEQLQSDSTERLDQLLHSAKLMEIHAEKQINKLKLDFDLLVQIIQERKEHITGKILEEKEFQLRQYTKQIDKLRQEITLYQSTLDAVMRSDDEMPETDLNMETVQILEQTIASARKKEETSLPEFPRFCFDISKEKVILENLDILRAPASPRIKDELCSQSHDKVTLKWRAAGHDRIDAYEIRYKIGDDRLATSGRNEDWMIVPNVKDCHYTVHGLQSGTRYMFGVKAINQAGSSRYHCTYIKTLGVSFTFDTETAHKKLRISNHGYTASKEESSKKTKESAKIWSFSVLGNVDIDCGRYYWEVVVCHSTSYTIGVAQVRDAKWNNPEKSDDFWCLYRLNHDWSARHGGKDVPLMVPPPGPPKIGVLLDYDFGFLAYFDGASGSLIHSFRVGKFLRAMKPVFSVGNKSLTINTGLAVPDHLHLGFNTRYC